MSHRLEPSFFKETQRIEPFFEFYAADTDTPSYTRNVSLQFERKPIHTLCSTREMSRMEWGHPGNFLSVSFPLCEPVQGVQDCTSECPRSQVEGE